MRQRIQVGVYAMGRNRVEELSGANGVGDVRKKLVKWYKLCFKMNKF